MREKMNILSLHDLLFTNMYDENCRTGCLLKQCRHGSFFAARQSGTLKRFRAGENVE